MNTENTDKNPETNKTKTERLQAALDLASRNCPMLQGATVEYRRGQGFYVLHGGKTLAYLQNFKRGLSWLNECALTGRLVRSVVEVG